MISIRQHNNRDDWDSFIVVVSLEYWNYHNRRVANNTRYGDNSIITKIEKLLADSDGEYLQLYAGNSRPVMLKHQSFFMYLLGGNNYSNLRNILYGSHLELIRIKREILTIIDESDLFTITNNKVKQTIFGKLISEHIFDYKNFRKNKYCTELYTKLKLQSVTCPYCNDNTIRIVEFASITTVDNKKRAYLDMDHFMPKSRNPFFALSLFNLVPSCHDCNSVEKGDDFFDFDTHISPLDRSFNEEYKFELQSEYITCGIARENAIKLNNFGRADQTAENLHIEDRYKILNSAFDQSNYAKALDLVDFYMDYYDRATIGSVELEYFERSIKGFGVPYKKEEILKFNCGKLKRDVLSEIDYLHLIEY